MQPQTPSKLAQPRTSQPADALAQSPAPVQSEPVPTSEGGLDFNFTNFKDSGTGNPRLDNALIKQTTVLQGVIDGQDTSSSGGAARGLRELQNIGDPARFVQQKLDAVQSVHTDKVVAAFPSTDAAAREVQDKNKELSKPDALQRTYIEAISRADNEITKLAISREYTSNLTVSFLKEDSLTSTLLDLAGTFLPDSVKDANDFLGGNFFDIASNMQTLLSKFKSLSAEQRVAIFPAILNSALKATDGNKLKATELVSGFIGLDNPLGVSTFVFDALDAAAVIPQVKFVANLVKGAVEGTNLVKTAVEVNNVVKAGEANAVALTTADGELATGVDKLTAEQNVASFAMEGNPIFTAVTDGAAAPTVRSLEGTLKGSTSHLPFTEKSAVIAPFNIPDLTVELTGKEQRIVDSFQVVPASEVKRVNKVDKLLAGIDTQGVAIAGDAERAALKTKYIDEWADNVAAIEAERNISIVAKPEFVKDTVNGVVVSVTDHNGEATDVLIKFNADDITPWEQFSQSGVGGISSPDVLLKNLEGVVGEATLSQRQESRNLQLASKAFRASTKGVKSAGRGRLNSILLHGDEKERAFSRMELMYEGVPTPDGVIRLTSKEADAYAATRRVFDFLHGSKSESLLREFEFNGFGYNTLASDTIKFNKEGVFLRPGSKSPGNVPPLIYSMEDGAILDTSSRVAQLRLADDGYGVFKFHRPVRMEMPNGEVKFVKTALMKTDGVGTLPESILNKHTGYVTKIYKNVYFVARTKQGALIDGVAEPGGLWRTEGFFGGKREANLWREKFLAKNGHVNPDDVVITEDRALPEEARGDAQLMSYGTLFGGSRTKRKLFYGINEGATARVNAFQALERNLSHIAANGSMSEFRLGVVEKFRKSAGRFLEDPNNWRSGVRKSVPPKTAAFVERTRDWINKQLHFGTERERAFEAIMARMADFASEGPLAAKKIPGSAVLAKGGKTFEQTFLDLGQKNPTGLLRAASFHILLGAFSPSQLLVQAQNMIIALSLNPLKFPKLLPRYMAMRMAMLAKDNKLFHSLLAPAGLMEKERFASMVERWDRTGFHQSVKMTADTSAASQGFAMDDTAVKRALSMTGDGLDATLLPFAEGERFGRGYSWLFAEDEWRAANPGKVIDALTEREISTRALALTMNMDRANAAPWQEGLLGVALQFKQVTSKFAETLFGMNRNLTRAERVKMMAGNFIAYGAGGGLAFGGDWIEKQYAAARGIDLGKASQEELAAIRDGVSGFMFEFLFDVRVSSDRFSMVRGVNDLFDALIDDNKSFVETLAGPFATVPSRLFEAVDKLATLYGSPKDLVLNPEDSIETLKILGEVFSSWRNFRAAQEWAAVGAATNKRGERIFNITAQDRNLIRLKTLGIAPERQSDIYRMKDFNTSHAADVQELRDGLLIIAKALVTGRINGKQYTAAQERLLDRTDLKPAEVRDALDGFRKALRITGTEENKQWQKYLETTLKSGDTLPTLEKEGARRQ